MKKAFLIIFLLAALISAYPAQAAIDKYAPGDTIVIGEFVYDDDMVATTTANCRVTIYSPLNPSGDPVVLNTPMTPLASGWNYYSTTTVVDEGIWPTTMTCGVEGVDLANLDKTFIVGYVNASTTAIASSVWNNSATSSIADAVNTNTNATVLSASSSLASAIFSIPARVWDATYSGARRLSDALFGTGDSGSLATQSDLESASSSLATTVENQSASVISSLSGTIESASSSLSAQMNSLTTNGWRARLSDFGQTTPNTTYRATLQILNGASVPTDADFTPVVTIYDSGRAERVIGEAMIRDSAGTYHYNYPVPDAAINGVWETEVSVVLAGETLTLNDYWEVEGSPAQVRVVGISDRSVDTITADVLITNEGSADYFDYLYEWCVVSSENNACGDNDGDDIDYGSGGKRILKGEDWNTSFYPIVPEPGEYWFKIVVYWGTEATGASRTFTAEVATPPIVPPPPGGGGGSGGSSKPTACRGADFNHDSKVNSVDFSILLYFWKTAATANPCVDANRDGRVDSTDFSILLYQWGSAGLPVIKK